MFSSTKRAAQFRRDESGATAMVFALSVLPIAAVVGAAVDGARWYSAQQATGAAVDAALLAGARLMQSNPLGDAEAMTAALTHYKAGIAGRVAVQSDTISFKLVDNRTAVSVAGDATLQTTFLNSVGIKSLPIYSSAKAAKASFLSGANAGSNLEVSLVLDFTGSMCDGSAESCSTGVKLDGLRAAAKELVDIVVKDDQSSLTSRVALVPFSERIRIAKNDGDASLMTTLTNLPLTWSGYTRDCVRGSGDSTGESASTWTCLEMEPEATLKSGFQIMPCVTERIYSEHWNENDQMDYTDDAPGSGRWLMGHGGDRRVNFANSTDSNPVTSGIGATKDDPGQQWNYSTGGWCHNVPTNNVIVPLSSDKQMLKSSIDAYNAKGGTAGPLATSFGWFMLSPKWAGIWPSNSAPGAYAEMKQLNGNGAPKLRKVAVIMTDGVFNTMRGSNMNNTKKVGDHATEICKGMKREGIEVYTVGFALDQLPGDKRTDAEEMLKECGTTVRHFYSTLNVEQLTIAFRDIALKMKPVRLIQ